MFIRDVQRSDKAVELKRMMSEMSMPDRELQNRMPVGQMLEVTLAQKRFWFLKAMVGRLRSTLPPTPAGVPTTIALLSTSGFTLEAHELADRRADRTVLMIEQNAGGG